MITWNSTTSAITWLALFSALLPSGSALRCYSCLTKRSDPTSCSDPYRPQERHERVCPPPYADAVCFKVVLSNAFDARLGEQLYSRGCVSLEQFAQVAGNEHEADGVRVLHASHCATDFCNG